MLLLSFFKYNKEFWATIIYKALKKFTKFIWNKRDTSMHKMAALDNNLCEQHINKNERLTLTSQAGGECTHQHLVPRVGGSFWPKQLVLLPTY